MLGVHYETAARWVRSGRLEAVRLSRRKLLIPKEKCRAMLGEAAGKGPETGAVQRWFPLVGTLSPREAARLRQLAQDFERTEDQD